jgi:translation initiation factor IF-2
MIDQDTAILVVEELGHKPKLVSADALEDNLVRETSPSTRVRWSRARRW